MKQFEYKMESAAIVPAFYRQLQNCKVTPSETVIFLTDDASPRELVAAGFAACSLIGCTTYEVRVPTGSDVRYVGSNPLDAPGLIGAFEAANLIVSLMVGFFSGWERAVRQAGGRILNILDVAPVLMTLQAGQELKRAALAAKKQVQATKTVRVTSDAGTDFTYEIDHDAPYLCHYGFADEPGHMDQWGQGMMATFPVEGSTHGVIKVRPGDIWALPYTRLVQSEINLELRDGHVTDVSGGFDADLFKTWLDDAKISESDMDPFAVSHLGWGLNPKAVYRDVVGDEQRADHLTASVRALPGSFLFSTGPSHRRKTKGHIDMPLLNCSVTLDNRTIINRGRIVDAEMIVQA